jgi:hypothetical protein
MMTGGGGEGSIKPGQTILGIRAWCRRTSFAKLVQRRNNSSSFNLIGNCSYCNTAKYITNLWLADSL